MPMTDAPDTIMTLDDLAAYVKLSKSSLYKLCQAGKVPGAKVGRTWRFHKDVIDAWIKTGVPPTQAYGSTQDGRKRRSQTRKAR
jgi:excisionase family DNA binding protein